MTAYDWSAVIEGGITGTACHTVDRRPKPFFDMTPTERLYRSECGESAWSVRVSPKHEGKLTAMLIANKPVVCRFFKDGDDTIVERCLLVSIWKYSEGQTVCDFVGVGAPKPTAKPTAIPT